MNKLDEQTKQSDKRAYIEGHGKCHRNLRKNPAQLGGVGEGFSAESTPTLPLKSSNISVYMLQSEESTESETQESI